jgi:protocatechuate 3,4-dioxygenase beta subunit
LGDVAHRDLKGSSPPGQAPLYRRPRPGTHPPLDYPEYRATALRHPKAPLVIVPQTLSETTGPVFGAGSVGPLDHDLTRQHPGEPLGERIIVGGRVVDEDGRPVAGTLVEIWQANAAGRYAHKQDHHPAPLDPNFSGAGRALTDGEGRYRFVTIRPGARARRRVIAAFDLDATVPEWALGFRFDLVLRGREATPMAG